VSHREIARIVFAVLFTKWPLVVQRVMTISRWYATRATIWFRVVCSWCQRGPPKAYTTYETVQQEEQYWESAKRYRQVLQDSDARSSGSSKTGACVPLIISYAPGLLPPYRTLTATDVNAVEYYLSARTFCKWHRMVFPGTVRSAFQNIPQRLINSIA